MAEQYKDPWADTMNQAVGALYKHYLTRPSQADMAAAQLENELKQQQLENEKAQLRNYNLAYQKGQFELGNQQQQRNAADMFTKSYSNILPVGVEQPLQKGEYGPNPAVTQQDRNNEIAGLFDKFAPTLDKDTVTAARDALGTAGALRFEDPIQRQLAIDERASSYDALSPDYTLTPGAVRFGGDNQQVASAPFKEGGGSYIRQPDGTVISIDGGVPPEMTTAVQTDLQTKDIAFDTYRTFTDNYRNAIVNNPGGVGTRGNVARLADGLLGQVSSFAPGSEFETTLRNIVNTTAGQYTDPATGQIMNADLYDAATVASLLPFVAAEAIVGQGGRSLSNEDRELVRQAVGSPDQWLATPDKLISRMDQLDRIVENLRVKYQGRQTGDRPMTPAPGSDNLSLNNGNQNVVKWVLDANGNPVPSGGQ